MSKNFNIHDWQDKQRQLLEQEKSDNDWKGLDAEVAKFVGGRFASWMSPGNPPFSQEYNKAPYFDKFIEDLMEVINDYKGEEEIDEQNTTGGGASFNVGTGMGHFGSKKKKK